MEILNYPIKGNAQAAQTFTVPSIPCTKLLGITLYIIKDIGPSGSFGDVIVSIWNTGPDGKPSAPGMASAVVPAANIGSDPSNAAVDVVFATPPVLTAGQMYAVVVTSPTTGQSMNYKLLGQEPGGPTDYYNGGRYYHTADQSGDTWGQGSPWTDVRIGFCFGGCVPEPDAGDGCTYTQGYWKNHPEAWPVANLTLGSVTYTKAQLLSIFSQPVKGNGLVSLAHQLIAAKLNIANGADPSAVAATIAAADALIGSRVVPPVGSGSLAPSAASGLTYVLDQYNNGIIGPGHCLN
jgi:hypothetical protein